MALFRIWWQAASAWLVVGIPSGLVMIYIFRQMCCSCASAIGAIQMDVDWRKGQPSCGEEAVYGPLIEIGGTNESAAEASDAVSRWIFRGALGSIVYGIALLALGATLAMHMGGSVSGFTAELFESLTMAIAKAAVARAACNVNRRLTPLARQVVGRWVLVVAVVKTCMALTSLAGTFIFSTMADKDYENVCFAMYLFRWSMLLAMPLQCISGFAFWRLKVRATRYAGQTANFGGWVALLIEGNFVSGAGVWWAGYLDTVHEAGMSVAIFFIFAALGQIISGIALVLINWKVKQHFKEQVSTQAEMPTIVGQPISDMRP